MRLLVAAAGLAAGILIETHQTPPSRRPLQPDAGRWKKENPQGADAKAKRPSPSTPNRRADDPREALENLHADRVWMPCKPDAD
jgi:hypothetical protein